MPEPLVRVRAPGKLVLAGEYAVVLGAPAIAAAVDRHVEASCSEADDWRFIARAGRAPVPAEGAPPFLRAAQATARAYLAAHGRSVAPLEVAMHSDLVGADGHKLGLGSSAAVVAAATAAILSACGVDVEGPEGRERVFKLAFLAHRAAQGNGSGLDVATAVVGGVVHYQPCDPEFLRAGGPSLATVDAPWPGLQLEALPFPPGWRLLAGFSGQAVGTSGLIAAVARGWQRDPSLRDAFLAGCRDAVQGAALALERADFPAFRAAFALNRDLLARLAAGVGVVLETPELTDLVEGAEACGAACKFSGAGGGDCAVAIAPDEGVVRRVVDRWRAGGHPRIPLDLDVHGLRRLGASPALRNFT